jgi:hypothetical protein
MRAPACRYTMVRGCVRGTMSSYLVVISMSPYFSYVSSSEPRYAGPVLLTGWEIWSGARLVGLAWFFLRPRRHRTRPRMAMTTAMTPMAIPALAPVDKPPAPTSSESSSFSFLSSSESDEPVAAADSEALVSEVSALVSVLGADVSVACCYMVNTHIHVI